MLIKKDWQYGWQQAGCNVRRRPPDIARTRQLNLKKTVDNVKTFGLSLCKI